MKKSILSAARRGLITAAAFLLAGCLNDKGTEVGSEKWNGDVDDFLGVCCGWSNTVKGAFTDSRDGKSYETVKIGSHKWMAKNLNFDTLNGTGSWCYDDNRDNCVKYGRLYDWSTAMGISRSYNNSTWDGNEKRRGICPSGWHLPLESELDNLVKTVDYSGKKLKSTSGWSYSGNGSDDYGFSALPGGYRSYSSYYESGLEGYWWVATEYSSGYAYVMNLEYGNSSVWWGFRSKEYGHSVRCVADD